MLRSKLLNRKITQFIKSIFIFCLVLFWLFTGFPPVWLNPRFPQKVKEALAAQVTIDATVHTTAASHNGGSPTTVFISQSTGYAFYRDSTGYCAYSKTTDGGVTWGAAVNVFTTNTACLQIAVWYDRWTPGDTTGTLIHIAVIDSTNDDIFYRYLDTSNDTLSTGPVNITSGRGYAGSLGAGTNHVALTKGTDGALYAAVSDASDNMAVRCTTTCTTATNWTVSEPASWTTGNDNQILVPMLSGNILFLWWDISVTTNDIKYSRWNGSSWSAWANVDTALDNTTYDASWGAAVDPSTGNVYLAHAASAATLGTDDDIRVKRFNASNGTWTTLTDVVTNSVCAGVSNCGITGAKIARDNTTGYLYVLYSAQSTPGTASTGNVYFKISTDGGSTWSSEFGPVYSTNDDIYGARLSLSDSSGILRIYATWYAATPDDLFGRPIAPLTFNQSAYRLFNNTDSTDVGTPLAAQDTAATLSSSGQAFRLRMLLHIGVSDLFRSTGASPTGEQDFKLQFAQRGTDNLCDTAFSGETYADVTAATAIAYNDNLTPADGATLTANANDPTHGGDTIVNQTYEELNNFTNSVAVINSGQDGKWDFSLIDNGATQGASYCFRVVKSDGSLLDTYSVIPEISIPVAQPLLTQNDWRIYVDNDTIDPTDPWPSGSLNLAENEALRAIPAANDPIDPGDEIRLRMTIEVSSSTLSAGSEGFILQYKETNDCTDATSWTDVDASGGSGTWRFASSSVTDGTALTTLKLTVADIAGRYSKSDPTSTNPNAVSAGQDLEWDWHIEYNGTESSRTFCFRMIRDDSTALDAYNSDSYPKVDTRPGTANLMRHGNFFSTGVERGFFWAD